MPNISVIVPVFNAKDYLPQCIDSILAQSFTDFELILVDDGSTDGSGEICERFAGRDSRIVVIHQENAGISAARNTGLRHAAGLFVFFVDNDDLIHPDCLEVLFSLQALENADYIVGGRQQFNSEDSLTMRTYLSQDHRVISSKEYFDCGNERRFVTGHLFRRDLITMLLFDSGVILGEDAAFNYSFLLKYPNVRIVLYGEPTYYWRIRKDSASHRVGGNYGFFAIGEWCLKEYQESNLIVHGLGSLLLLEALKELMLFRHQGFPEKKAIRDCNRQIKKGVRYLHHNPRITLKNKMSYSVLACVPFSYSFYRWMKDDLGL